MSAETDPLTMPGYVRGVDFDDPREDISVGVLMPNGRLAGRSFANREEAEAWCHPEEGEQVVEFNILCECSWSS